jgi:hypothetical protein
MWFAKHDSEGPISFSLSLTQKETPQIYTDETDKKKQIAAMWLRITTTS